jgi:hypothetical protein
VRRRPSRGGTAPVLHATPVGRLLSQRATADVYSFDPATAAVERIATLPQPLTHAGTAVRDGYVHIAGGRGTSGALGDGVYLLRARGGSR